MTTQFYAPDIVCGGCAAAIQRSLSTASGVQKVDVDIESKTVAVTHDADQTSASELLATLDEAGFPATLADNTAPDNAS